MHARLHVLWQVFLNVGSSLSRRFVFIFEKLFVVTKTKDDAKSAKKSLSIESLSLFSLSLSLSLSLSSLSLFLLLSYSALHMWKFTRVFFSFHTNSFSPSLILLSLHRHNFLVSSIKVTVSDPTPMSSDTFKDDKDSLTSPSPFSSLPSTSLSSLPTALDGDMKRTRKGLREKEKKDIVYSSMSDLMEKMTDKKLRESMILTREK